MQILKITIYMENDELRLEDLADEWAKPELEELMIREVDTRISFLISRQIIFHPKKL